MRHHLLHILMVLLLYSCCKRLKNNEIAKPITLAFRLFGNIVAGEILLEILYNLPWFVPVPWIWIAFSLFIGIIQAFIFTVLTANYLGMALSEEH